jgi:hypothetical protein
MPGKSSKNLTERILFWLPRILVIIFILFISLFALDAFSEPNSFWMNLAGFLIHLIPSFILIGILIFAWKFEEYGGILFFFLGIGFTMFFKNVS